MVGTHAVISEAVTFERLGLAVVDEQHRFGVAQRGALQAKAGELEPHMLALTATPIPRTLALTVYGDLAISTLRHPPPGRLPIRTEIRDRSALPRIEAFIADEARAGRQTFVVAPLVVESDALSAASAEAEAERLRAALPDLTRGPRARPAAGRRSGMRPWSGSRRRETDVLVATTVIEVGIDVPNATVMVIEDAERFGLAQLHQLRGRVGRGAHRSFCILVSDSTDELARRRLEVVRGSSDGFDIAEADLVLRGVGQRARHAAVRPAAAARGVAVRPAPPRARGAGPRAGPLPGGRGSRRSPAGASSSASSARSRRLTPSGDAGLMRVIAGTARGLAARCAPKDPTDATDQRQGQGVAVRNDRATRVVDARVLDLYAGSGAIGIEALSRGAAQAAFVERGRPAVAVIRENLDRTGLGGPCGDPRARRSRPFSIAQPGDAGWDVAVLDPPYAERTLDVPLDGSGRTWRRGRWWWSSISGETPMPAAGGLAVTRTRRFGETALTFLEEER